jgi:hypothetical protein
MLYTLRYWAASAHSEASKFIAETGHVAGLNNEFRANPFVFASHNPLWPGDACTLHHIAENGYCPMFTCRSSLLSLLCRALRLILGVDIGCHDTSSRTGMIGRGFQEPSSGATLRCFSKATDRSYRRS